MVKKWNEETMKEYVEITSNSGYKFIKLLENETDNRIIVRCDKGHEYEVRFYNFKTGYRCPYCAKSEAGSYHKFNIEDIKKYVLENTNCKLISTEYVNARTKLEFECSCGNRFKTTFDIFKNRNQKQCNQCSLKITGMKRKIKLKDLISVVEKNNCKIENIDMNDIYSTTKIEVICECGEKFTSSYVILKNGIGKCEKCLSIYRSESQLLSYEYVKNKIEDAGYKLISKTHKKVRDKIKIECDFGHIYETTFSNFNKGSRCSICNMSNLEIRVKAILDKYNIEYLTQHTFPDLIYEKRLKCDFYLPKYNTVCEVMGEQHERPVSIFQGEEGFIKRKMLDSLKKEYCKTNNINFIEIWYYDISKSEDILKKELQLEA